MNFKISHFRFFIYLTAVFLLFSLCSSLREFRTYSTRASCEMAQNPNYPFAYSKYKGQRIENKGRVNSNLQDFRHQCQVLGGKSKCHICEKIICNSESKSCELQLQGVNSSLMSTNIPIVSDTSWAIGGKFKHDYAGSSTSHMCVLLSGNDCISPYNTDYSSCRTRCFGYGFPKPPLKELAPKRSVVDIYPGMFRWEDDGQVDLFNYPKNCLELGQQQGVSCSYSGPYNKNPSFNPQGYTFTVAGVGIAGFVDGPVTSAQFNFPQDIVIDQFRNIFVADTKNHAIRMVSAAGIVTTIAGRGPNYPGFKDGNCKNATFSSPKGLDMRYETINGVNTIVIVVADTGSHRIRKIEYVPSTNKCKVSCLSGLCGNNTLSFADTVFKAPPLTGYADGSGLEARFSSPYSVAFIGSKYIAVADSGNYLIRIILANNGSTYTLAGNIIPGEKDADGKPLAGCTPPCLQGNPGFRDGNLTFAQFYNPVVVRPGPQNSVWVLDEHRVRIIEMPNVITTMYGIYSQARVSTIAGTSLEGHDDGLAQLSTFYYSAGIFVNDQGIAYVADAASCKIRRVTPYPLVSQATQCSSLITDFIRPSGCISYDPPLDKIGRKISRVEGNIQYNFEMFPMTPTLSPTREPTFTPTAANSAYTLMPSSDNSMEPTMEPTAELYRLDKNRGKYIKNCVGVPPQDRLDKHFIFKDGDNLVVDDHREFIDEDSEQGMAILLTCPASCQISDGIVQGTTWYSEKSSICLAARHDGKIDSNGGIIQVIIERFDYLAQFGRENFINGSLQSGINSGDIPRSTHRVFKIESYNISNSMVHTIAGSPNAPLESVCGYRDGQPASSALFNNPGGVTARKGATLSDTEYLFIADTYNHRIRALSAVCTFICENGGRCVGDDKCQCTTGWAGIDCTKPICSSPCGPNKLCIGPNMCGCKPGYSGPNCDIPLCRQKCMNGGFCSAPDTCSCPQGWFDTNCSTPVCSNTCANGGNCTAPNVCACPKQWTGSDCRVPVCKQTCLNKGYCVAPDTCLCPPQWSNYDCSAPVCSQGFFEPYPSSDPKAYFTVQVAKKPTFKNCDVQSWCNATNEFECDQTHIEYGQLAVPYGPAYRETTGRKIPVKACTELELPTDFKIPYELLRADNSTTGYRRFSPFTPYLSDDRNPWRGYLNATDGHTGPWVYEADRQIARVNWFNFSQGRYVCANGGVCVAPDICSCAHGWIGFDCRTPVCEQGYYKSEQTSYVTGQGTSNQYEIFDPFMKNTTQRLGWPYSNPNFTIQVEYYVNRSYVRREINFTEARIRYLGPVNYSSDGNYAVSYQGGYRCTIRADTQWENEYFVFEHPNFYSQYMDKRKQADNVTYTFWEGFEWPPTHRKSRILDQIVPFSNRTYAFTNEGWRRRGIWNLTSNPWAFGICILEFDRNCTDSTKEFDLNTLTEGLLTLDTDISYRPRITYNDLRVHSRGRWKESTGKCVDEVIRGCANNGTCVAPNTCKCAKGWKGPDCRTPICSQTCHHHGNCTSPNVCTCERGWTGFDCQIPLCAQECQNGGQCVAPDTCQCFQFDNAFYDGRIAGGRPQFQDENGDPLKTGWTGYDCSIPICVQAEKFVLNVPTNVEAKGFIKLGGRGADGLLSCVDKSTGLTLPRCPQYDVYLSGNDGTSFQSGCGWDPFDSGCCLYGAESTVTCYKCDDAIATYDNNTFYCAGEYTVTSGFITELDKFADFLDDNRNFRTCGDYHSPRDHDLTRQITDYGIAKYYVDVLNPEQSSYTFRSNLTSNRFLCHVQKWIQGDYVDVAGLGDITGAGSVYGLSKGRHVRINTPNIIKTIATQKFNRGPKVYGEGIYVCYNKGTCLAPDICTCQDGYEGYDCNTPLCRHLQPSGSVSGCLNGGICSSKDSCDCIQTNSVLWATHPEAPRAVTGWTGSDCSMPMCSQGYYDPFCTDLPQAPGGEGCYRCANGGNCTAPDICTCAPGWTGYDCKTPVCEVVADPLTRTQLGTTYEDKVIAFESDPCGVRSIHGVHGWKGTKYARGNCTQPNQCTCLCKLPYSFKSCRKLGKLCDGPWQDPIVAVRNVLLARGPEFTFGSVDCAYGFEGNVNNMDQFTTCHQTIFLPSTQDRQSLGLIVGFSLLGFFLIAFYRFASVRLRRKFLLAKIERRKTKRSSEESMLTAGSSSFNAG